MTLVIMQRKLGYSQGKRWLDRSYKITGVLTSDAYYYCFKKMTSKYIITFASEPFAEGRFRYAYKGTWTETSSKPGQKCVVKKFKDSYTWESSGWDVTLRMYSRAKELANTFGNNIEYTDCDRAIVNYCPEPVQRGVRLNEYVVHEDYLEGNFIKWCNNYGYVSQEARGADYILTSFMHWTWACSKGQEMVGDIQGVKKPGGGYKLTDPAVMSTTGQYGVTDTGVEGMAMFFLIHKCSQYCSSLPKPTLAHFVGKIPDHLLQGALEFQNLSRRGTTYTHELKFTDDVKQELVSAFLTIAQGK